MPIKCLALVPDNYNPLRPYGLVVWLHPPGKFVQDELVNRWKQLAQDHDLIVLAPQSADEKRWLSTEIEFVRKTIDDVMRTYSIDPTRVVLHGYQAGGAMAYYVALCPSRCGAGGGPGRITAAQCDSANRPPTRFNRWPCIVYPQRNRNWRIE